MPRAATARQSRTAVIAWALGAAALGVLGAALSPLVASVVSESDSLAELVEALLPGTSTDSSTVFVSGLLGITGMLAACAAAQAMLRMRADESSGRSELLLSTPLTRSRLLLSQSAVAAGAVIIITGAVGIAVWITAIATDAPGDADLAVAGLAHAPAAAVFIALPALLIALVPRIAVGATWLLLAVSVVIGQLGEMLELPDAIRVLSPFSHVSAVPVEEVDGAEVALLLGIAVVAVGLAAVLARRRELVAG
jgi:ABC-2 type transport system permease protein